MVMENGRITKDIELKEVTVKGELRKVVNNRLAINISKDETTFIDFTAWGSTAEFIANYFKKGDGICLIGKLRNSIFKKGDIEFPIIYLNVDEAKGVPGTKKES